MVSRACRAKIKLRILLDKGLEDNIKVSTELLLQVMMSIG